MGIRITEWAEGMIAIGEEWQDWLNVNGHVEECGVGVGETTCEEGHERHLIYDDWDEERTTKALEALDYCVSAAEADPGY